MSTKQLIIIENNHDVVNHIIDKNNIDAARFIIDWYDIGCHITKGKKLSDTLESLSSRFPHQIFLTANRINFRISHDEIIKCAEIVERKRLKIFVHTPYLINLASNEEYIVNSLKEHLRVSNLIGFKGCVVHVGKYTNKSIEEATYNMKKNIIKSIENASSNCPLLLETPAGQGTEMLTTCEEFVKFVEDINDSRLGICIDTCHIFSSGILPTKYINFIVENEKWREYIKLFHFNDSEKDCKSCVDRHAFIFCGKIPMEELVYTAYIGQIYNIPLVIE